MSRNLLEKKIYFVTFEYWIFQFKIFFRSLNPLLLVFLFISIGICVATGLWQKSVNESIAAAATNLGYSYISAYIFYILVIFLPFYRKKRILGIYIHNKTFFIYQSVWKVYELILTKSNIDIDKNIIPQTTDLSNFLEG